MQVQERVREQMDKNQREYYLREQMKAIQNELGESEGSDSDLTEYRKKLAETQLPQEVREKLEKELGRLAKQPYSSSEATVIRNYLDICLELHQEIISDRASVHAHHLDRNTGILLHHIQIILHLVCHTL